MIGNRFPMRYPNAVMLLSFAVASLAPPSSAQTKPSDYSFTDRHLSQNWPSLPKDANERADEPFPVSDLVMAELTSQKCRSLVSEDGISRLDAGSDRIADTNASATESFYKVWRHYYSWIQQVENFNQLRLGKRIDGLNQEQWEQLQSSLSTPSVQERLSKQIRKTEIDRQKIRSILDKYLNEPGSEYITKKSKMADLSAKILFDRLPSDSGETKAACEGYPKAIGDFVSATDNLHRQLILVGDAL
jgi:hypothetical protein